MCHIRPAVPCDAPTLSAIAIKAKGSWGYTLDQLEAWRDLLTVSEADFPVQPTFVAEDVGGILGFYSLAPGTEEWNLEHLWVVPKSMGRGVGRALLLHAIETARVGGAKRVLIDADPNAEAFYAACGATRVGAILAALPTRPRAAAAGHPCCTVTRVRADADRRDLIARLQPATRPRSRTSLVGNSRSSEESKATPALAQSAGFAVT